MVDCNLKLDVVEHCENFKFLGVSLEKIVIVVLYHMRRHRPRSKIQSVMFLSADYPQGIDFYSEHTKK